jgi:hypothetical protein
MIVMLHQHSPSHRYTYNVEQSAAIKVGLKSGGPISPGSMPQDRPIGRSYKSDWTDLFQSVRALS